MKPFNVKHCDQCGSSVTIVTDCPSPFGPWWYVCDECHKFIYKNHVLGEDGNRSCLHTRYQVGKTMVRTKEQWRYHE